MRDNTGPGHEPQEAGRAREESPIQPRIEPEAGELPSSRLPDEEYAAKMARLLARAEEQQRNQQQQ